MDVARALESVLEASPQAAQEAALVAELKAGSEEAFAYILATYRNPVYSLVAHMVGNQAEAADVLQNVFVKVFRGIGLFHGPSALKTWIYRIALREALNHRRGWFRRRAHELLALDGTGEPALTLLARADAGDSPYATAEQAERRRLVKGALDALPPAYRAVLVLREIDGCSYEEIAEVLSLAEGTVKSRLARGRALLRRKLTPLVSS